MRPEELRKQLHGVCVISITPFKEDGSFDAKGYEKNLEFILKGGLDKTNATIVVGGSTGECGAMNPAERKEVLECALAVCGGRLPVIAGCNSTNVREAIELAQHAEAHGAAGVMALSPYYYPAKDEECIYAFYKALAENTGLGILLYNNFEVMNIDCPISVLKRLKEFPNVVGMKECTPCLLYTSATAPKRLLAAGIFDSLAKLPEVVHNTQIESYQDCTLEKYICTVNSRAIYEFLMGEGPRVYDQGLASGRFTDVILTNLLHTSVVSGFSCGVNQLALAHGLYDFLRRSFTAQAAHLLHGEIVAVGILMQLKFNRMADAYVLGVRRLMAHMQLPTRLPDLGFEPTPENLQLLVDYLLPATGLSPADEPRLRAAIAEIC